jgi:hypothetical protein
MPDQWLAGRSDLHEEVGFATRAKVEIGDELILYAIPQRKIIGVAEVLSHPIKSGKEERWPWRSKTRLKLGIVDYDRAPDLSDIEEPGGRELSKSVQQKSHLELRWAEYARARDELERAFDVSKGDLRQ